MANPNQVIFEKNSDPVGDMNSLLWQVIDIAAANPAAKPDPRIWPHLLVYAPDHIKQRLKALFKATGQNADRQMGMFAQSDKSFEKIRAMLIEKIAKGYYEKQPGYRSSKPWQDGGTSPEQEEARKHARFFAEHYFPPVEERGDEQAEPAAFKGAQEELAKMHAQLVEAFAKKHYESWANQDGYVPWQDGGNSDKQEEARKIALSLVDGLTPENFYPVNSECSSETVLPGAEIRTEIKIDYSPVMDKWLKSLTKEGSDGSDRDYFNTWTGQSSQDNAKLATEVGDALDVLKNAFKNNPDFAWTWHCAIWSGAHDEGLSSDAANRAAARVMKMAFDIDTSENANFDPEHRMAGKKVDAVIKSENIHHHSV